MLELAHDATDGETAKFYGFDPIAEALDMTFTSPQLDLFALCHERLMNAIQAGRVDGPVAAWTRLLVWAALRQQRGA